MKMKEFLNYAQNVSATITMIIWAVWLCLYLGGCATMTIRTEAGADADGKPFMVQEVSGKAKAVIEASRQTLDGTLTIDPDTGILTVDIKSGQAVEGLEVDGLDAIAGFFAKTLAEIVSIYAPHP